jgi:hypothetical protein
MVSKYVKAWGILATALVAFLRVPAAAQFVQQDERVRLASREEGEVVVQAAWELRRGLIPKPDCSHFVNAVYAQAGLDYEYASSSDVFDGIDSFRRVQTPQAGDLVVWQGHIGIVVDPEEHSFYSSVLSGFAIEDYRSDYWTSRGHPRFYRYLVDQMHGARLLAHVNALQVFPVLKQRYGPSVWSTSNHDANLPDEADDESPAGNTSGKLAASDTQIFDSVFVSRSRKPSKEEVRAAMIRTADTNSEHLLRAATLDSHPSVMVVDEFTVVKINIHDRSGWAEMEVKGLGSTQYGRTELKPIAERWRLNLHQEQQGWILLSPQDRVYLRRDQVIRALTNRLALMSGTQGNRQELRKTVKMLDELLVEKIARSTAAAHNSPADSVHAYGSPKL